MSDEVKAVQGGVRCPRHGMQKGATYGAQDPAPCGCGWVWENGKLIAVPQRGTIKREVKR
jgi:hypothetical protein